MKTYPISHDSKVVSELIVNTIFVALATAAVILRLVSRRLRKVELWIDDYTVMVALALVYILYGIQIADAKYGMRVHIDVIPMENLTILLKMLVAYQVIYGTALLFGKMSYLYFYRRIFINEGMRKATLIVMGVVVAWWVANNLQIFLICTPFNSNWDVTVKSHCGNRPAAFTTIGAINMVTDVIIMLLPIHFVRKLQMPSSSKIGVCVIFGLGLLICAVSIVRMRVLSQLNFDDISYNMLDSVFWTVTEPSLVIINACIPTMRHLVKSLLPGTAWQGSQPKYTSDNNTQSFQRMQDEYPLTLTTDKRNVLSTVKVTNHDEGDESSASIDPGDNDSERRIVRTEGAINVKKEWTVSG